MIKITLAEHESRLAVKIKQLKQNGYQSPPIEALRNSGTRRTPQKRALLRKLREIGSPFLANIGETEE